MWSTEVYRRDYSHDVMLLPVDREQFIHMCLSACYPVVMLGQHIWRDDLSSSALRNVSPSPVLVVRMFAMFHLQVCSRLWVSGL